MASLDLFGLVAEFKTADELVAATRAARAQGYSQLEAYSPFPVEGLAEALDFRRTSIPLVVLVGGIVGCVSGYLLAYYCAAIAYPINIGGRPLNSWPAFIPVTFETTILVAALSAVLGMLALNGLPMPHHPLFNVPSFDRATQDRFFLCIRAVDRQFDLDSTRRFLEGLGPVGVTDVPM
jgi:hypothetical protein